MLVWLVCLFGVCYLIVLSAARLYVGGICCGCEFPVDSVVLGLVCCFAVLLFLGLVEFACLVFSGYLVVVYCYFLVWVGWFWVGWCAVISWLFGGLVGLGVVFAGLLLLLFTWVGAAVLVVCGFGVLGVWCVLVCCLLGGLVVVYRLLVLACGFVGFGVGIWFGMVSMAFYFELVVWVVFFGFRWYVAWLCVVGCFVLGLWIGGFWVLALAGFLILDLVGWYRFSQFGA